MELNFAGFLQSRLSVDWLTEKNEWANDSNQFLFMLIFQL